MPGAAIPSKRQPLSGLPSVTFPPGSIVSTKLITANDDRGSPHSHGPFLNLAKQASAFHRGEPPLSRTPMGCNDEEQRATGTTDIVPRVAPIHPSIYKPPPQSRLPCHLFVGRTERRGAMGTRCPKCHYVARQEA